MIDEERLEGPDEGQPGVGLGNDPAMSRVKINIGSYI